ncbi:MAG: CopG family transcriptional regulator [Candidatus Liptonbacteria bacterium]|nr:CopG family transcriptional regulator [Candidatus Liptonbacteria bacterium]
MKYTTVSIPEPLNKKLQKIIKNSGFASTSSFVTFILREVLSQQNEDGEKEKVSFDKESVKEHLRALGYLK